MRVKSIGTALAGSLIGLAVGVLILYGLGIDLIQPFIGNRSPSRPAVEAPLLNSPAPDFVLKSLDGSTVALGDFRGKPVLINFWATWCAPCLIEMPLLQDRYDRYAPDLTILAVNFNESEADVQSYVDELGLTFEVLLDPGGVVNGQVYRVLGYPTTVVVDREGLIRAIHIGILVEGQLDDYLEEVGLVE